MSAVFVESPCQFTGDTIVNSLAWSNTDQIAAMSTNTADENDREINQVMFLNNEVICAPTIAPLLFYL